MSLDANHLLCVMDCDYLFGGARANFSDAHRVEYPKLIDLIKKDRSPDLTYHFHAFIAMKDKPTGFGQAQFLSRLVQWGFDVHTGKLAYNSVTGDKERDNLSDMIIHFLKHFTCDHYGNTYPQTLVAVTGSFAFADIYEALLYQGVTVEVFSYKEWEASPISLRGNLPVISRHVLLTDSILYVPSSSA